MCNLVIPGEFGYSRQLIARITLIAINPGNANFLFNKLYELKNRALQVANLFSLAAAAYFLGGWKKLPNSGLYQ